MGVFRSTGADGSPPVYFDDGCGSRTDLLRRLIHVHRTVAIAGGRPRANESEGSRRWKRSISVRYIQISRIRCA